MFETPRLRLREFTELDAPFIHALVNDPDWLRYIGDRQVHSIDDAIGYLRAGPMASYVEHGFGLWCVEHRATGEAVGMCGLLRRPTLPGVDIGYALLPAARGRGIAFEAASATIERARTVHALPSVLAIVSPENAASIRLLERLGMQLVGPRALTPDTPPVLLFECSFHTRGAL